MASLHKRILKSGTAFRIAYRLNGKQYTEYLPPGTTATRARVILAEFNRRLNFHKLGVKPFKNPLRDAGDPTTLNQYLKWFLANKKTAKRRGREIARKSIYLYEFSFNLLFDALGRNCPIDNISLPKFETILNRYKPASRSAYIRSLRAAWDFGIEHGILKDNPFLKIPITKDKKIPETLTIEEKDTIYAQIKHPEARIGFALARYMGLRREEICQNIKWQDIYWSQNLINIPDAKTGEGQKVPLIPDLRSILSNHKGEDEDFLVSLHPHTLTHYVTAARREAGIHKKGALHILRHSFAHELLSQGVDIRIIQLLLRHTNINTTMIYTQIPTDQLTDHISKIKL